MRIGFFGGVREIGGNIILIEDKGVGIEFDFGRRFASSFTFFNDTIVGRSEKGFSDYTALGELPPFKGFYNSGYEIENPLDIEIAGSFFSHAHLDHIGNINFIKDSVPKYMSRYSKSMLNYFLQFGIINGNIKNVNVIEEELQIGSFKVKPVFVDHDIPGAVAYIIDTPKGVVIYTGDLYFAGIEKEKTKNFVNYAKSLNPYILISEGTRIGWGGVTNLSEEELEDEIRAVVTTYKGLAIGNVYEPHIARIATFYNAAKSLGRRLVMTESYAFSLLELSIAGNALASAILNDESTFVYSSKAAIDGWAEPIKNKFVKAEFVNEWQEKIILLLNYKSLPELLDIKPRSGAIYIQSGGEPIANVDTHNAKIQENWINYFKMPFFRIHSPGHASEVEILNMVKEINPDILLPIHTQIPERFSMVFEKTKVLDKGILYEF
ncbi:MAG: MBL fold metallo-hydrolase [Caldisericaceae bacterium]